MSPAATLSIPAEVQAIIFDCDGVLVDSWRSTRHYFNSIRAAVGLGPMDSGQEDYCFVHTVPVSVAHIVPVADLERALDAARNFPFEQLLPLLQLMPGIVGVLEQLRAAGLKLAVDTNAGAEQHIILDNMGIRDHFDMIVTTEDVIRGKPSPEGVRLILDRFGLTPGSALFIGDSHLDRQAAESAGVPFWGFGPHAPAGVARLEHWDALAQVL